jgi:type I restriction enzyme M protein
MAEAKWCGHDSRGNTIPYDDLPAIYENYRNYVSNQLNSSSLGFAIRYDEVSGLILVPSYYDPRIEKDLEALSGTHELRSIGELKKLGIIDITTGDEIGKLAYGTGQIPYIRSSDLSNWEIKADPKHQVSEEIFHKYGTKQDIRKDDILVVKDGTYLIGTSAMVTESDLPMLLQSHVFKIRLNNIEILDPYLFLAVLNSSIVQRQIRSKQLSQDIIDSIGSKFEEIVLPIPKDFAVKRGIAEKAKKVVELREASKRLIKELKTSI